MIKNLQRLILDNSAMNSFVLGSFGGPIRCSDAVVHFNPPPLAHWNPPEPSKVFWELLDFARVFLKSENLLLVLSFGRTIVKNSYLLQNMAEGLNFLKNTRQRFVS